MIRDIGPAPRLIDAICPSRRGYFIGMIFLVLSFFYLASIEKPPIVWIWLWNFYSQRRPSFAALRRCDSLVFFFFFFFLPLCLKLRLFQSDLPDPGYLHIYTLSNAYLLYRVTEDIVPENGKCPAPSGPSRMISRRVANGLTMASNHRPTIKNWTPNYPLDSVIVPVSLV